MTTRVIVFFILVVSMFLAGCAGGLENRREAAYDHYWHCVSQAVQPYVLGSPLPARQSVLAAQALSLIHIPSPRDKRQSRMPSSA